MDGGVDGKWAVRESQSGAGGCGLAGRSAPRSSAKDEDICDGHSRLVSSRLVADRVSCDMRLIGVHGPTTTDQKSRKFIHVPLRFDVFPFRQSCWKTDGKKGSKYPNWKFITLETLQVLVFMRVCGADPPQ